MTKKNLLLTIGSVTWGTLGFVFTLGLIHHRTPGFSPKSPDHITRTTSAFKALPPNGADVVVIGTSHLYRGFDPLRFEQKTGLSAYNLSFNGMSAPEMAHIANLVAGVSKSKNVKYVVLEGRGLSLPDDKNLSSVRVIHASRIEDWDKYKAISLSAKDYKYWKPRLLATFGISRLQNYAFGQGPEDYVSTIENGELRRRSLKAQGKVLNGSSPLKKAVRDAKANLLVVKNKGYGYQEGQIKPSALAEMSLKYSKISKWEATKVKLSSDEKSHYRKMVNRLKSEGVKTHIVLPPTISPEWMRSHDKFVAGDLKLPTHDLRIHQNPQAFVNLDVWSDHGHLNHKGAAIFTDLLANNFLKWNNPSVKPKSVLATLVVNQDKLPDCEVN